MYLGSVLSKPQSLETLLKLSIDVYNLHVFTHMKTLNPFIGAVLYFFRLQFQYGGSWAARHPTTTLPTDSVTEVVLSADEVLTGVQYRSGDVIDSLQFVTNVETYPKVGGDGGRQGSVTGAEIKFFIGSVHADAVSRLKAVFMEC